MYIFKMKRFFSFCKWLLRAGGCFLDVTSFGSYIQTNPILLFGNIFHLFLEGGVKAIPSTAAAVKKRLGRNPKKRRVNLRVTTFIHFSQRYLTPTTTTNKTIKSFWFPALFLNLEVNVEKDVCVCTRNPLLSFFSVGYVNF